MLDLNYTFLIQLANFIIIMLLLNQILYKPIRRIIRERAEGMAASLSEVEKFNSSVEAKIKNYEATLDEARRNGLDARNKLKDEALTKEKSILESANKDAGGVMKDARAKIASDVSTATTTLKGKVEGFAQKAVTGILGRAV